MNLPGLSRTLLIQVHAHHEWMAERLRDGDELPPGGMMAKNIANDELLSCALRGRDHALRRLEAWRKRLFNKHITTGGDSGEGEAFVGVGVGRNADGVRGCFGEGNIYEVEEGNLEREAFGQLLLASAARNETGDLDAGDGAVGTSVRRTHIAAADYQDAERRIVGILRTHYAGPPKVQAIASPYSISIGLGAWHGMLSLERRTTNVTRRPLQFIWLALAEELLLRKSFALSFCLFLVCGSLSRGGSAQSRVSKTEISARPHLFQVDVGGVISRSDVVLGRPNFASGEAMPLGNGRLGVALWSADGLTAQLNRNDTLPGRLSPGQVVISGLSTLARAGDYAGRLDLYRGEFREEGGGMSARAFVEPDKDALVIEVKGADPNQPQTAVLKLWSPRTPHAGATGNTAFLAESWIDNKNPGSSGRAFGALSAITAEGRNVSAAVTDPLTVTVSFTPFPDGHFRVIVAAPHYDGTGDALQMARSSLSPGSENAHLSWWQNFWARTGIIKITSKDGAGEYMENLRNLYLFVAAIEKGTEYPGSQAGIADMISSAQDEHRWDPSAFWHWNLRMQVAANIGAGLFDLNDTYFNLYRENLANIERWTRENMNNRPGICVPETMRFNGAGIEYESAWNPPSVGRDCDANFKPYYNARTLSTGAEVSLWIWQQYLATRDRAFLAENYPVMASSARFLVAYQKTAADGLLHTSPSNAHEQQWDVTDPTTDLAAIQTLFPATIEAANLLGKDADLVHDLKAALPRIPPLPRTQPFPPHSRLSESADAENSDVIAASHQPGAEDHNIENIGLEPVWPYSIIGDTSPMFPLAQRTYAHRPNSSAVDWSYDPIQAARLHLGNEVASTLDETTQKFQGFVNGMAKWEASAKEFYVEQAAVVADALQECLVQDYDGVIRIAPAIPLGWDFDGGVYVRGKTKVDVQTRKGSVIAVVIEAGNAQTIKVRNPWPGQEVDVTPAGAGKAVITSKSAILEFEAAAGTSYLLNTHENGGGQVESVGGIRAASAKRFGRVQIGLFKDDK